MLASCAAILFIYVRSRSGRETKVNREFKLHVSGNGKRQVRTFLAKFSLNVFLAYFLSCVERIIMYFSFKTASKFTYSLLPDTVKLIFAWRFPFDV
jgi:hypothetical protein